MNLLGAALYDPAGAVSKVTTRGLGAGFGSTVATSGLGAGYGSAPPVVPAVPAGGGWRQQLDVNALWRKRQDEEWVILHG